MEVLKVKIDFEKPKSVKIYAIPYIFATTLSLYKLDTLLLKQKNLPVLKKPVISNTAFT
jgi:hypothetical protein